MLQIKYHFLGAKETSRNSLREFKNMHGPRVFAAVLVPVSAHSDLR